MSDRNTFAFDATPNMFRYAQDTSGWHIFGRSATFAGQFGWQKVGQGYGALPSPFPASPGVCTSAAPLVVVRFSTCNRPFMVQ